MAMTQLNGRTMGRSGEEYNKARERKKVQVRVKRRKISIYIYITPEGLNSLERAFVILAE